MSTGPKYKEYEDQAKREDSFFNYPKPYPLKRDLVNAGFYFLGPGSGNDDDCQCYYCGVRLFNWTKEDDPMNEHEKFRPHCSFIKSLTNPTNTVLPVNIHPAEGTEFNPYPGAEFKNINPQTHFDPKPGTVTSITHSKRNGVSTPVSKLTLYSLESQNSQIHQSSKMQQYPLQQIPNTMETALVETATTNPSHNIIISTSLPPNSTQSPAIPNRFHSPFIAHDNGRLHGAHPINNISSTYQPYTSSRTEENINTATFPPKEIPIFFSDPAQQQPPYQQPQPQAHYTGASATSPFSPYIRASYQAEPRMNTAQYGQNLHQELDPRPILFPNVDNVRYSTRTASHNFTSIHTPYTSNQYNMAPGSNVISSSYQQPLNRFPQHLQQPHQSNFEYPQTQALRAKYPQDPQYL